MQINRGKGTPRPQCRKTGVALRYLFNTYKYNAKRRGYSFLLDEEEFRQLLAKPCFYCDTPPILLCKRDYDTVLYTGLDRVDNTLGYVTGNCVPCCKRCNLMKGTMSIQQFFDAVAVIHNKKVSASDHERRGEPTLKHTEPRIQ